MSFRLHCYGKPYADETTLDAAKKAAEAHIHACPQGAMEWAKPIRWHEVDYQPGLPRHSWVSAARGEWLDHRIDDTSAES